MAIIEKNKVINQTRTRKNKLTCVSEASWEICAPCAAVMLLAALLLASRPSTCVWLMFTMAGS